ncbi:hypothetical protein, partial [Acinetobacter baumannii]|uniref:hypothetical protein n=1 Tax=Acinetobacter baumannii TaxID=470 RepID=UPI00339B2610
KFLVFLNDLPRIPLELWYWLFTKYKTHFYSSLSDGTAELKELKAQLKYLLEKGFIRPTIFLWGALNLICKEEGWVP